MTKYLAAVLSMVALAVLAVVLVAAVRPAPAARQPIAPAAPDLSAATGQTLEKLKRLEAALATIKRLGSGGVTVAAPLALGVEAPATTSAAAAGRQSGTGSTAAPAAPAAPVVSLIYLSSEMTRAVINGQMVTVGDTLPGSARVVAIDADRVVIETKGRRRILHVDKPRVVGGLQTQQEGVK